MYFSSRRRPLRNETNENQETMRRCHITFEALSDYCTGIAGVETQEQILSHLEADCVPCTARLAFLNSALSGMKAASQVLAPPFPLEAAKALFRERFRATKKTPLIAQLTFDGFRSLAPLGVRGVTSPFQQLYRADGYDIDLYQEPQGEDEWYIIGQAITQDDDAFPALTAAEMTSTEGVTIPAHLDQSESQTEFHFSALTVGKYTLLLRLIEIEILIPEVSVGG